MRKKRIFFLSLMCFNLPLQGWDSCSDNVWMLQITQESMYCASIKFQQCWILFGIFFMQHNSHVKLICVSRGSCSMRRRLIVPSVCSPVPVCIQGISDLLIIPETHSHGGYDLCLMHKMVCTVIFPIGVLKSPNLIFVWLVPECC